MGFFKSVFGGAGKVLKKMHEGACNFVKGFGGNGVYAVKNLFGAVCDGTFMHLLQDFSCTPKHAFKKAHCYYQFERSR